MRGTVTGLAADDVTLSPGYVVLRVVVTVNLDGGNGEMTYIVPGGREPCIGQRVEVEVTPA